MTETWQKLEANAAAAQERTIISLFEDTGRFERFSASSDDLLLDVSKANLDHAALGLLVKLAGETGVAEARAAMLCGDKINETENRAALNSDRAAGRGRGGCAPCHCENTGT